MPPRLKFISLTAALALASLACNTATNMMAGLLGEADMDPPAATPTRPPATAEFGAPANPYPGPVGLGDHYFPDLGNGGYDALHYQIALEVDVAGNFIEGTTTIDLALTERLSSLNLEFSGLRIEQLLVNGRGALYQRQNDELTIYLPEIMEAGEQAVLEITYAGVPGSDEQQPVYSRGWINYGTGIAVAGEPTGASVWYPVNEHPADKALYSYSITVDSRYQVGANGQLVDVEEHNGQTTYHWHMNQPIAPYLTTLAIGEFDVEESQGPNGIVIRNYFGRGVSQSVRQDFAQTAEMLEYFEEIFGPYPFETYGVVVHDVPLNFALETATLSVFGNSFTDEYVVVHELAHHWFGNAVGLEQWQDIWLNEGFATYASDLWNEHKDGRSAMELNIRSTYESLAAYAAYNQSVTGDPGANWLFDYASVYARGGLALHALRLEIGDEAFFETLRTYTARFGGGNASTADLISTSEEITGRDLGDFFDAWLYQLELPDIPQMGLYAADYQE